MMKQSMMALALMLVCPVAMTQAKEPALVTNDRGLTESVMTMQVRGDLTFGTDGVVKEHHIATKLDPKIAAYVDEVIGKWKFQPYRQDGVAVNARTYFLMTLAARAKGSENYELTLDSRHFGDKPFMTREERQKEDEAKSSRKCVTECMVFEPRRPGYPVGLMMAGVGGGVIVHLYLNPDGSVADAVVGQSALYNIRGGDKVLDDARKLLEKSVLRYAKQIRFTPGTGSPLVGDNHLVGALPVEFLIEGMNLDNDGVWRLEQRGKANLASWLVNDPDRWVGVSDTSGGGFIAMADSPYKLASDSAKAP